MHYVIHPAIVTALAGVLCFGLGAAMLLDAEARNLHRDFAFAFVVLGFVLTALAVGRARHF